MRQGGAGQSILRINTALDEWLDLMCHVLQITTEALRLVLDLGALQG